MVIVKYLSCMGHGDTSISDRRSTTSHDPYHQRTVGAASYGMTPGKRAGPKSALAYRERVEHDAAATNYVGSAAYLAIAVARGDGHGIDNRIGADRDWPAINLRGGGWRTAIRGVVDDCPGSGVRDGDRYRAAV